MIGKSIAHFEITAKIGEGGMGEVYQATDTKLNREVALKILPESFAQDPQRMGRFQREAQVLASLNHANIAQIYGLEEGLSPEARDLDETSQGMDPDSQYSSRRSQAPSPTCLVMELVEGEDLSERIARGPIPLEEALPIALQIAEALEDAHEKGIIHRDLKPANIKLTSEGNVKVLDFGLAKAAEEERAAENIANSPTLTMQATQAGVILGTAAYMSPEQAKGQPVDRRADIWAFGVVLFEMLAGQRAFEGEDVSEILASVIMGEANWQAVPKDLADPVKRLLLRCLSKELRTRLQAIGEARFVIESYLDRTSGQQPDAVEATEGLRPSLQRVVPWFVAGVLSILLLASLWLSWPSEGPIKPPLRLSVDLGAEVNLLARMDGVSAALSPDGSVLAFIGASEGAQQQLFLRYLNQLEATALTGTEGARQPEFSPDGRWIVFQADRQLKKIAITGGEVVTFCETGVSRGISWVEHGAIVFASGLREGLSRVPAAGGKPEAVTTLAEGEETHRWPQVLPGGEAVLYTASESGVQFKSAQIVVQSLARAEKKILVEGGSQGRYLPSGHLMYVHDGRLFVVPLDLRSLEIRGQPVPILEGVSSSSITGVSHFAFSKTGTLAYIPGRPTEVASQLEWLKRDGSREALSPLPAFVGRFELSPSGRKLALEIRDDQQSDIWIYDIDRDTLSRLTFDPANDFLPVWSPTGESIAFASGRSGDWNIYCKRADGSGEVQRLSESDHSQLPFSWHPSGRYLALAETTPDRERDVRILTLEGNDQAGWSGGSLTDFVSTPIWEAQPRFSPDGEWLAYVSFETGTPEVFIRPFPGLGGKWQISSGGGVWPEWSQIEPRLFFSQLSSGEMYRASYRIRGTTFVADRPERWEEGDFHKEPDSSSFDVHPDGRLLLRAAGDDSSRDPHKLVLFLNFFDYLKEKVPDDQ